MKYLAILLIIFIVMLETSSCNRSQIVFNLEVDPLLNYPVYENKYDAYIYKERDSNRYDKRKYNIGDTIFKDLRDGKSEIILTKYPYVTRDKICTFESIEAYKSNDSIWLLFRTPFGGIYIWIHELLYSGYESLAGGKSNQYGKENHTSSAIIIPFKESKLVVKSLSFNVGDTIRGYLYIETKEYYEFGEMCRNFYRGPFTTIIVNREEFEKFNIPRIYI